VTAAERVACGAVLLAALLAPLAVLWLLLAEVARRTPADGGLS
jgi:hypothetical protein